VEDLHGAKSGSERLVSGVTGGPQAVGFTETEYTDKKCE